MIEPPSASLVAPFLQFFFAEHLIAHRRVSPETVASYRDTFRLLLPFAAKKNKKAIEKLLVEEINPTIVKTFLAELEAKRGCSTTTRNQRLAAIHAFAKFVGLHNPEHVE